MTSSAAPRAHPKYTYRPRKLRRLTGCSSSFDESGGQSLFQDSGVRLSRELPHARLGEVLLTSIFVL